MGRTERTQRKELERTVGEDKKELLERHFGRTEFNTLGRTRFKSTKERERNLRASRQELLERTLGWKEPAGRTGKNT